SARIPEGGREPRSSPATLQDHRREGDRRLAHHACRLLARVHSHRGQRRHHPRAAADLLGQLILGGVAALALAGCTLGPADHEREPPAMSLVGSVPYAGQGTECTPGAAPECGVPIDTSITLRFDRYLRPASAVRQSLRVFTGSPNNGVGLLRPEYDVIERVVVYRLTSRLQPGTLYTVELLTPSAESADGFQAFDGAPLVERDAPLSFHF